MTAPELSAEEAAVVARFDAAQTPSEVLEAGDQAATERWAEASRRIRAALASPAPAPQAESRYPCYCLPGPARCDTLGEHCDRANASEDFR